MGKRQIGELSTHEFVITILISAVATIPLEDNTIPLTNSLLPILIFISLEILESALSMKSIKFRDLIQGKPIFVIKDGELRQNEMKRLRLTINDLVDNLRQQGVFDVSSVENAVVETNGKLSVQQKAAETPPSAEDLKVEKNEVTVPVTVISDGNIVNEYFGNRKFKNEEIKLLVAGAGKKTEDIMLMTVDKNGKVFIIDKENS